MKKCILLIILSILVTAAEAQAQESENDLELIQKTLDHYINGQALGDSVLIGKAFHSSWQLKAYNNNEFIEVPKSEYLVGYKKRDAKPTNWSGRIVFIDITNNAAVAKVEISTSKLLFTDYFNLLKTNKGWFIVDKISTRTSHKTFDEPSSNSKG